MEINRNQVNRLLALDDDALQAKLRQIAAALALPNADSLLDSEHIGALRTMLQNAKGEDLGRLLGSLGQERADALLKLLGKDGTP